MPIFEATFDPRGILTGVNQAKRSVNQLGTSFDQLGHSVGDLVKGAAALFGAYKAVDWGKNAVLAAGRYDALGLAMYQVGKNAGYSNKQMDSFDASLQRTGIAMKESRQLLTMLAGANLDLTHSAGLARIAQDAAGISGRNSSEAFQSLVHGLTTGQTEVLRNIGLQVNFEQAYSNTAKTLNKTTAALSANEKMQARVNAVVESGALISGAYEALMESPFKRMGSLTRQFDNIQVLTGELGMGIFSGLIDEVDSLARGTEGWLKSLKEAGALENMGNTIGDHFKTGAIAVGTYTAALVLSRSEIGANISALIQKSKQSQLTALTTYKAAQQELVLAQAQKTSLIEQRARISTIQQHTALNNSLAVSDARVTAATAKLTQAQHTASRASRGLGVARGALNALGGPWVLGLTAAAAGVALLSSRETSAEFVSRKYAASLREVNKELWGIEEGTQHASDNLASRTQSQLEALQKENQRLLEEQSARLVNSVAPASWLRGSKEYQKAHYDVKKLADAFKSGIITAKEFEKRAEALAVSLGLNLGGGVQDAATALMFLVRRGEEINQLRFDDIINQFHALGNAGQDAAERIVRSFLAIFHGPEGSQQAFENLFPVLPQKPNKPEGTLSSGGGASSYDKQAAAIRNAENELARLTYTEIEYQRLLMKNQATEWADKGVPADLINRYKEAKEISFHEAAFTDATSAIQDFEREYQSAMGNVGGLTSSITSEMDIYRQAITETYQSGNTGAYEYAQVLERIQELENRRLLEASRRLSAGVSLAFQDYERDATNAATGAYTAMSNSLTGMEDALVHFAQTGKLEFSSLINTMIADLARLTIQQSITGPIFNALGSAMGSLFSGDGGSGGATVGSSVNAGAGIYPNAKGGIYGNNALSRYSNSIVSTPTYFAFAQGGIPNRGLMGEAGPEAIMPLSRTSSGDLGVKVEGASSPNFTLTIIDQRGKNAPPIETQQTPNANGGMDIRMIIQGEVVKALGNGAADSALRNRYALRPQAGGV